MISPQVPPKTFPGVYVYPEELPQWVLRSSVTAAYHPYYQNIHIRYDQGVITLLHEYGHHLIHLMGGRERAQNQYDVLYRKSYPFWTWLNKMLLVTIGGLHTRFGFFESGEEWVNW